MKLKAVMTCGELLLPKDLEELGGLIDIKAAGCALSEKELAVDLREADLLIMGGEEKLALRAIEGSSLKAVVFVGKNYETFISKEARALLGERKIPIYATGGGEASVAKTTAEEIATFWLAQGKISRQMKWSPRSAENLLKDQEVMVIGAGNIGMSVISQLEGKCKAVYHAGGRSAKAELLGRGIDYEPNLAKAFGMADIVTIHSVFVPAATEGMIRFEHLKNMRPNSILINNARAELVDPGDFILFLTLRPDVICIWDVFYLEGDAYNDSMDDFYKCIFLPAKTNFFFTQHTAAFRFPELTKPEYGRNLLKIVLENVLEKPA